MTYLNKACKLSLSNPSCSLLFHLPMHSTFCSFQQLLQHGGTQMLLVEMFTKCSEPKKCEERCFCGLSDFGWEKMWFPRNHDTTDPCSEVLRDVLIQPELHKLQTLREIDAPPWAPRPWPGLRTQQTHWEMARKSPKFPKVHQTFVGKVRPCHTCDFWFPSFFSRWSYN